MACIPIWKCTPAKERIRIEIVLDTWAWVEYWKGNDRVRGFFEGQHTRITSMITITELERFYGADPTRMSSMIASIRTRSKLIPIDLEIARAAGSVRRSMNGGGIADAIIYATALRHRAKVVTGDPHFRSLAGVIFVESS